MLNINVEAWPHFPSVHGHMDNMSITITILLMVIYILVMVIQVIVVPMVILTVVTYRFA